MAIEREKEQLELLRQGKLPAFRWVYDEYHEKVYGYCLKLLSNPQVAEEITEDVFVRLWEKRSMIDTSLSIGGLLMKFTKDFVWNHLKKEARKTRQRSQYVLERPALSTNGLESDLIFRDYLDIAEAAIRQLPEKRQLVFNLRYKTGLDNREIARRLNISETTVRVHLLKATRFLRNYLASHPEIPLFFVPVYLTCWV